MIYAIVKPVPGHIKAYEKAGCGKERADEAEIEHGILRLGHAKDGEYDLQAVPEGMQLGLGAGRPGPIGYGHFNYAQPLLDALNGHLRLDLKAGCGEVQAAYALPGKSPVAGEDVGQMDPVDGGEEEVDHFVAEHIQALESSALHAAVPIAHHMLCPSLQHRLEKTGCLGGKIGAVAVDEKYIVLLYHLQDLFHGLALARAGLDKDARSSGSGYIYRAVGAVAVCQKDVRKSQSLELPDNRAYGLLFVEGGDEDADISVFGANISFGHGNMMQG